MGLDDFYDDDSSALSVIEQLIFTYKNVSLPAVRSFLIFDSEDPQVCEVGFKILNSIIIKCNLEEQELFDILELIFIHMHDQSDRVKEASLWSFHALCYQKIIPLDNIKSFYDEETDGLFETLLSFLNEIDDNNSSILAAISLEILSLFAIENIDDCFQSIFDLFFQFISEINSEQLNSDSNLAFIQIRIERALLQICSNAFEDEELIFYILSVFSTFLNHILQLDIIQSEYLKDLHYFLCEITDLFLQNNILSTLSFDYENYQELIQEIINNLTEFATENSISALTSLFISLGELISPDISILFQLFESFPNESINSIVRYSIIQSNYSLIEHFWEIIEDKHSLFFAPLIDQIESESIRLDESQIQIFERLFDPLFLSDFLIILEITISNSETADNWIEFGFNILYSLKQNQSEDDEEQQIEEIFEQNINLIIRFLQSATASNIELCRSLIIDSDLMYILDYAMTNPDVDSEAELVFIALNEIIASD